MYFKRLDMHGFKSFAEPVSLEFMDGMTCIVGPNGSGKSNIADAIKWVLGEQSPKNLRGAKMEEVIFAGTENRKARGIAEVTLVIDNRDGILPIEYNDVEITRKMYRSGESEYSINGRQCRLKDIKELILDTGIGVEGYSLIGQGKISEIINNKAEGRRELFEAAAGISKYRIRKTEAEKKLTNSVNNLDRVNDIILEIEGRIDGLREDSIKAQKYIELSSQYKEIEVTLAVVQAEKLEERIKAVNDELDEAKRLVDEYSRSRDENSELLESLKEEMASIENRLGELREEIQSRNDEINRLQSSITMAEAGVTSYEKDIARINDNMEKNRGRMKSEGDTITENEAESDRLDKELKELRDRLEVQNREYEAAEKEATEKFDEIESKKSAAFRLYGEINVSKTEISGINSMIDSLERRKVKLDGDIEEAEKNLADLNIELGDSTSDAEKTAGVRDNLISVLNTDRSQVKKLGDELRGYENSRNDIDSRLHKAVTKKDLLMGFENSYEGYVYAVKYIMGRKNQIKGIHGVASELMDVPGGYETAIQTALGGGMQNIVCEDERTAAECVNLLKRDKAGRATFLPLTGIRGGKNVSEGRDAPYLRKENGFLGFAVEIVKHDSRYDRIMEYLLGRTAIADTLESAIRLSKKYNSGIRFVTLDGDDINPSGAITGGRIKNSGPNVFERKNDIKSLENDIARYENELSEADEKIAKLQGKIDEAEGEIRKNEDALKGFDSSLMDYKADINVKNQKKTLIEGDIRKWRKELGDIDAEILEMQGMINEAQAEIDRKQEEIKVNEEFMDDKSRAYDESKASAETMLSEINELKDRISAVESDSRLAQERIRKSRQEKERIAKDIESEEKEIREIESAMADLKESADGYRSDLEKLEDEMKDCKAKESQLKDSRAQASDKETETEKLLRTLESDINKALGDKHDAELKKAKFEVQLDGVKNRLWDAFEITFVEALSMKNPNISLTAAQRDSRELKNRMRELEPVNIGAIEEYKQVSERYAFMTEQRKDLNEAIDSLNGIIKDMDKKINVRFMTSFEEISIEFNKAFSELFGGGVAQLKLENAENVLESTVEIIAQPPGKKLQNMNLLSGGEKSLTAIALLCAILKVRPTPFCILDEVEAALDETNIGRFVDYIRAFEGVQFIVVTHQKVTMEKADVMYGITMPEKGISKIISLKMRKGE